MKMIDVHADDFGESVHASTDILDCLKAGKLDSISVLSNMSCFDRCVQLYRDAESEFPVKPLLSVHLNFMEGSCLSAAGELPDLVDRDGHFSISWMKLFFYSYLPARRRIKDELKREMKLQIKKVLRAFPEIAPLRLDSHQHTHMIPVVADALFEVIEEEKWTVEYIRNAREPIMPFLRTPRFYKTYRPVNFIKNIILNYCAFFFEKKLRARRMPQMYLWGLVMSGRMDEARVKTLLPSMMHTAEKKGRYLEILFHPGRVLAGEITPEFSQKEAVDFHLSEDRNTEKEVVLNLNTGGREKVK